LPGGNLQTIYAAKVAKRHAGKPPKWLRERWSTPDADFIDVDWRAEGGTNVDPNTPLLVLFPGLEGSSQSHYAAAFAAETQRRGWRMAVPHFRGCSGEINLAPRAYHSGDDKDIGWILKSFRSCHQGPIYAVGISLGGNALMCWAGETGQEAAQTVASVVSICSPLDLTASGHAIDRGFNQWVYARMFLRTMKPRALAKLNQYPGLFEKQRLLSATTLYEFDNVFTAPLHGYKDTDDYWSRASAKPKLQKVAIPALAINARNDPFIPAQSLPTSEEVSRHVTLWQPESGGHVGFVSGTFPGDLLDMPNAVMDWMSHG
jgi:predicted alpha/beta-fold hydrolase